MAEEEIMHRAVPITGELVPGNAVPPIRVETPIRKPSDFGENVELARDVSVKQVKVVNVVEKMFLMAQADRQHLLHIPKLHTYSKS